MLPTFTTENLLYTSKRINIKETSYNVYLGGMLVISFLEYDFLSFIYHGFSPLEIYSEYGFAGTTSCRFYFVSHKYLSLYMALLTSLSQVLIFNFILANILF